MFIDDDDVDDLSSTQDKMPTITSELPEYGVL